MKKLLLISMLIGAMPLAMMAQDDDLYFVPKKKKAQVEKVKDITPVVAPKPKAKSSYEVIDGDTTKLDVIDFTEGKGVYPADTLETEDFALTKNMVRFDDYDVSDNDAFWAGYRAGRDTWMWHSPWYYGRYGWYDPWYYGSWYSYSRWYSPYYYSWYDPWFYGWYDPWYGPYYSYYGYYGWPYYRYGYAYYGGGGYRYYYGRTGNAGTIDIRGGHGSSRVISNGRFGYSSRNMSRQRSLRERTIGTVRSSGTNTTRSTNRNNSFGNSSRMNVNYGGSRSNSNYSSGSFNSGSSRNSGGGFTSGGGASRSSSSGGGSRGGRR